MRMQVAWIAGFVAALLGQAPATESPTVADGRNTPVERLESMRGAMKSYEVTRDGVPPVAVKVQADPVFRSGKQNGNFLDGAIFLWLDAAGRPEAAMEAFLIGEPDAPNGKWIHEFTSLSTARLAASRDGKPRWYPAEPGIKFQPVPDAPKPAASPVQRLAQIRELASQFKADDDYGGGGNWNVLRMLTKPVARYGKAGATPEDGALFAFVEKTDPEVFLFIEARPGPNGAEWQYALAPMGCWAVKVKHKDRPVWELPWRSPGDPTKPLYNYQFWP